MTGTSSPVEASPPAPAHPRRRRLSWKKRLCFSAVAVVMFLLMLEGLCSVVVVCQDVFFGEPLAERVHTEYDPELGWINQADFAQPDMYGPGISLRTNAQRFRHAGDVAPDVPPGRMRVIVTGDSFALGYGVGDADTWCAQLAELDPRLEVVNMGQGGYGPDQAWLWYRRVRGDAAEATDPEGLAHDVLLFTFVTADFGRMPHPHFTGYGKPVLTVRDGKLVANNTPVPRESYLLARIGRNGLALKQLNTYRVARRLLAPVVPPPPADEALQQSRDVTAAIARELVSWHAKRGSILVFVHLPMESDYRRPDTAWHEFLQEESERAGWIYLNLIPDFQQLPAEDVSRLFLKEGEVDYPGAAGHYNADGNAYVARLLYRRLLEVEGIAGRLEGPKGGRGQEAGVRMQVP